MNIPFSPPDISDKEIEEVIAALKSGWITTGPKTKELERRISEYCNTDKTVCLSAATTALEMTLRLLGIKEGDEVIVPAYTYTATCSVICHVGATPVMVDSQKDREEMDYSMMADAITEKTKVIIPVDIAGILCDYDRIFEIIEDKKELFEADNEKIYKDYQILSLHGQTKDALEKTQKGSWEYDILLPAYKCNMTDVQAGIGLGQLERYDSMLARRHEIIAKYDEAFKDSKVIIPQHNTETSKSSGHLYLTRIEGISMEDRNEIIIKMEERGISTNVHYKPLPLLTAYKNLGFDIKDYPNAYGLFENEISLPIYSKLTDEEVDYITDNLLDILKDY